MATHWLPLSEAWLTLVYQELWSYSGFLPSTCLMEPEAAGQDCVLPAAQQAGAGTLQSSFAGCPHSEPLSRLHPARLKQPGLPQAHILQLSATLHSRYRLQALLSYAYIDSPNLLWDEHWWVGGKSLIQAGMCRGNSPPENAQRLQFSHLTPNSRLPYLSVWRMEWHLHKDRLKISTHPLLTGASFSYSVPSANYLAQHPTALPFQV